MFAHEGGHGLVIVPAIILNREIPVVPTEGMQENPFKNFPLGIFSLFLAFPLGIMANGVLLYLSSRNIKQNCHYHTKEDIILLSVFTAFCLLNLSAVFTNLFGQDFAFIIRDILKIPTEDAWFKSILRISTYIIIPLVIAVWKGFAIDRILTISLSTYFANMVTVETFVPLLAPILMTSFWWLFIIGLPVFISTGVIIFKIHEFGENKDEIYC